jgi:endoglucanase
MDAELAVLLELTGLPTAAGREDRVIAWIQRWAAGRDRVTLDRDTAGNLRLLVGDCPADAERPVWVTGHLDHPAYVLTSVDGVRATAEFRGGVDDAYFPGAAVRVWTGGEGEGGSVAGQVTAFRGIDESVGRRFREVDLELGDDRAGASAGDVATWDLPGPEVIDGRLHAPVCDDLAAVAAAIAAAQRVLDAGTGGLRLLLTRAEEVGFIGALAAAEAGSVPANARLVCLENSRSYAESPIGGGPIVRVGDRSSTFDPDLTGAVARVCERLAEGEGGLDWQRRLMPGGTCEATAFSAHGYTATCVCLPLGHYHNMTGLDQDPPHSDPQIAREIIGIDDYLGLVDLLAALPSMLDADDKPPLRDRLAKLLRQRRDLLD